MLVYLRRKQSKPPKWMTRLQQAEPKFTFTLGPMLLGVFPSDIATAIAVGLHLAHRDDPWWQSCRSWQSAEAESSA